MSINNYDISIVIPCYNVSKYIKRCIKSIEDQTFKNYEIIIINDGSTDDILDILSSYPFQNKACVQILTFPNQGLSQARNEGIKVASGKYIYFFDPDDWISPNTLKENYELCEKNDCDAIQFGYQATDENGKPAWTSNGNKKNGLYNQRDIIQTLLPRFIGYSLWDISEFGTPLFNQKSEMCSVWRFLYKRELILRHNIFFPRGVKLIEDKIFNCHFFLYAQKIFIHNRIYYHYEIKPNGLMSLSLKNPQSLLKDKLDGITERKKLQELATNNLGIDLFPMYAGSLFLSGLELAVKNSSTIKGRKIFLTYIKQKDVQKAISKIPLRGNLKIKIPLFILKCKLYTLIFTLFYIARKCKIKIN